MKEFFVDFSILLLKITPALATGFFMFYIIKKDIEKSKYEEDDSDSGGTQ